MKEKIFYFYVLISLIGYIFLGTNLIGLNIKEYIFENFPIWLTALLIGIQIALFLFLYPRQMKK